MNDSSHNFSPGRLWTKAIPLLVLVGVLALERETPSIRLTPSLLTIALAGFAVFLSPRAVASWALFLFAPFVLTLIFVPNAGVYEKTSFIILRSTTYLAVAVLAVALSRYRVNSQRQLQSLLGILDALAAPVVVSDNDGNINFANRACCQLLGRGFSELKDMNFFAVFASGEERGKAVERYLKLFESSDSSEAKMRLTVGSASATESFDATCSILEHSGRKMLLCQLHNRNR